MSSYNIKFRANKLFNAYDMDLSFDHNLNVLVGENGCGKTTIMKMINSIINNDFISLSKVPFDYIELTIDNVTNKINYVDIQPIEIEFEDYKMKITNHPSFKFLVKDALEKKNNFNEFLEYIKIECKKLGKYTIDFRNDEYLENEELYLQEDIDMFKIKKYNIKYMLENNCIPRCLYGSKYYLQLIFNMYHNKNLKLVYYPKISKSYYYSFIDLDDKFYYFENINFIDKKKISRMLSKEFFKNKKVKFFKQNIAIYNKNNKLIDNDKLSSGEKKTVQFYKSLNNLKKDTIIILDEPELSMSFIWREKMIDILKREAKKSKIIIISQQIHMDDPKDLQLMVPIIRG